MTGTQLKIKTTGKRAAAVLKAGSFLAGLTAALALTAICIILFSGGRTRSSFLSAFDVTANNGTVISIAPQSLLLLFVFMLADSVLITMILFFAYSVFRNIAADGLPFTKPNAVLLKKTAVASLLLGVLGTCSDSLVDYYTIGAMPWNINPTGFITGMVLYCLALIFEYGFDLQQQSDETL